MKGVPTGSSTWAMYRALVGIGCVCALLIVTAYLWTAPVIAQKQAEAMHQAVFKVLPGTHSVVPLVVDGAGQLSSASPTQSASVYLGRDRAGRMTGVALAAEGMGYQDQIRLLYGYVPDQSAVVGMQVLSSRETPGLGSRIGDDAAFLAAFDHLVIPLSEDKRRIVHPLELVRAGRDRRPWQIDAISGATVSSRAVASIIATSSAHWVPQIQQQQQELQRIGRDE